MKVRWWFLPLAALALLPGALCVQYVRFQQDLDTASDALSRASVEDADAFLHDHVQAAIDHRFGAFAGVVGFTADRYLGPQNELVEIPDRFVELLLEKPDPNAVPDLDSLIRVRTGSVAVTVPTYDAFEDALTERVSAAGGYVADTELSHREDEVSNASLRVRIPADRLDALVSWTEEATRVRSLELYSSEVTEEWIDLDARLASARRTEGELLELLDRDGSELADVLAVETELMRIRTEIERTEGRQRVLRDQVALSTLTLEVSVETPYTPIVAKTFGEELVEAVGASILSMGAAVKGAIVFVAVLAPWLAALSVLGWICAVVWRRRSG